MEKLFYCIVFVFAAGTIFAQNEQDALRMSRPDYMGTARFVGMGGAMGALGGDASVMSTNPAGFGIYRRSEITLTPGYFVNSSVSDFGGTQDRGGNNNLALNNLTFVNHTPKRNNSGVLSTTWAIGYNRTANHFGGSFFRDENPNSSLLDPWQDRLDASGDPFDNGFAYDVTPGYEAWVLDRFEQNGQFFHANELHEGVQEQEVTRSGSNSDYTFNYAANINNRFFMGGTVLFSRYNFSENRVYSESEFPRDAEFSDLSEWEYMEDLELRGRAFELRIGGIYKVNDVMRFGAAYHLTSSVVIDERYETDVLSTFHPEGQGGQSEEHFAQSPSGTFNYRLKRPNRAIASAGFVIGKRGLIGIDYEFTDYSNLEYGEASGAAGFSDINEDMAAVLRATHNVRVGGEFRVDHYFARGGFRFDQNPYVAEVENDYGFMTYSLGAGYRDAKFFFDVAWRWRMSGEQRIFLYDPNYINAASLRQNSHAILFTGGFRW